LRQVPNFSLVGYDFTTGQEIAGSDVLKLTVTNTALTTENPAALLSAVFLTVNPDLTWQNTGSAFDGVAPEVTTGSGVLTNMDIAPAVNGTATDGGWALTNGTSSDGCFETYAGIDLSLYNVGITTVGCNYPAVKGKDLGPPEANYGIYSATTSVLSTSLNQQLPLIRGTAVFYLKPNSGLTSLDQIGGVAFVYGTEPSAKIVGQYVPSSLSHVPVPSGLMLLATACPSVALLLRWRRVASASVQMDRSTNRQ
jgi:hypothetical protein